MFSMRKRRMCQVVVIVMVCFLISSIYRILFVTEDYPAQRSTYQLVQKHFQEILTQEKGTGCQMPVLDPFSEEVARFDEDVEAVVCDEQEWVECYLSNCFVKEKIQKQMRDLVCIYKDIIYVNDSYYYLGKSVQVSGLEKYVLNRSDHVKVSCTGMDVNGLGLVKSRWFGFKAGYRPVESPSAATPSEDSPNVLMVLLDSTSRSTFIRLLSRSYKVLREDLGAVVMESYNIVGDSTAGALWPILTGHDELEVADSRRTPTNKNPVDLNPFIFSLLKDYGYRTAYYEDMPWVSTFNYRFNGFPEAPTDHYLRSFFEEEGKNQLMKCWDGPKRLYCMRDVSLAYFMLNYTSQFFDLDRKKFCLTFIAMYSHDDVSHIALIDDELAQFLRKFKNDGRLEDTVLFIMGDHGPRFAKHRNTYQGKIEERLPFVSVVLPETLKRYRPEALENLKRNSKVLTTPFDMHTTLLDSLGLMKHRNEYVVPGADFERGMSFLNPIPGSRSCGEAGVMPHWCACTNWHNVSAAEDVYQQAGKFLAEFINSLTEEKRDKCAKRGLASIEWVMRRTPKSNMLGFSGDNQVARYVGNYVRGKHVRGVTEYYQAKIVMSPGKAIYEASMSYLLKDKLFTISERDISRVNAYGNEPSCLSQTHPHLNKYCYCYWRS